MYGKCMESFLHRLGEKKQDYGENNSHNRQRMTVNTKCVVNIANIQMCEHHSEVLLERIKLVSVSTSVQTF